MRSTGRCIEWLSCAMGRSEVVLVHGLYHQPAHMSLLVDELQRRGSVVHVPRLHRGSLRADTRVVQEVVDRCGQPPIVVGHSYGGAVITGIRGASALVFVAAFVPDADESCASLCGGDALVNAQVREHPSGGTYIPSTAAGELFFADCDPAVRDRAVSLLMPQAAGHGRGQPEFVSWKATESLYLICSNDQALRPALQRRMAERCNSRLEINASHSPYLSMASRVADAIVETSDIRQHADR